MSQREPHGISEWYHQRRKRLRFLIALIGVPTTTWIASVAIAGGWIQRQLGLTSAPIVWFALQTAAILVLFIAAYAIRPTTDAQFPEASAEISSVHNYMIGLWATWFILYLGLTLQSVTLVSAQQERASTASSLIGLVLDSTARPEVTLRTHREVRLLAEAAALTTQPLDTAERQGRSVAAAAPSPSRTDDTLRRVSAPSRGPDSLVVEENDFTGRLKAFTAASTRYELLDRWWKWGLSGLNNLQTVLFLLLFASLAYPRSSRIMIWLWIVGWVAFTAAPIGLESLLRDGRDYVRALSGLAAGISLALLTGRIDSRFLGAPQGLVVLMYFYSILQVFWVGFAPSWQMAMVLSGVALSLKVFMFGLFAWLLESGMLLYYFQEMRWLLADASGRPGHPATLLTNVKARRDAFFKGLLPELQRFRREAIKALAASLGIKVLPPIADVQPHTDGRVVLDFELRDDKGGHVVGRCEEVVTMEVVERFQGHLAEIRRDSRVGVAGVLIARAPSRDLQESVEVGRARVYGFPIVTFDEQTRSLSGDLTLTYSSSPGPGGGDSRSSERV